jgi:hypothetical protein
MKDDLGTSTKAVITRFFMALLVLMMHLLLATLAILAFYGVERLTMALWGEQMPLLFGRVPLSYVFNFAQFGVLVILLFGGIAGVMGVFRLDFSAMRKARGKSKE